MNKIERVIYDVQIHIKNKERQLLIIQTELNCLKAHLDSLESIEKDKLIPHSTPINTLPLDDWSGLIKGGGTTTIFNPTHLITFTSSNPATP